MSPYFFIIVAEGLTTLIRRAEARGDLHGIQICRREPILTHLLFVDDYFLFFRANDREVANMKTILETYEQASGQAINYTKSEVSFSKNVDSEEQHRLVEALGVRTTMGAGKYLGVPSVVGRSKRSTFAYVKDRI